MNENYPGGIVPLASDLSYLDGGSGRRGRFADDATIQHGLHYNRETTRSENNCNRDIFGQAMGNISERFEDGTRRDENQRICDHINILGRDLKNDTIAAERRNDDQISALAAKIDVESRECLKQFCDLKEGQAEIKSNIKTTSLEERNQNLEDQLAEQRHRECCPAPARCVDPCCNGGSNGGGSNDTTVILQAQAQQFQALQQTFTAGLSAIAKAIERIDCKPGNSGE